MKALSSNILISPYDRLLASIISSRQILLYQPLNTSVNFVSSLILYNKVKILLIIVMYTFAKLLSKLIEVNFCLPPALPVFYLTTPALSIICILLLSTMKYYINLYNRVILTKIRRTGFTSQTSSIERVNLNLKANVITNLAIYLGFFLKHFFNVKDVFYMVKNIVNLQITYNKSMMTQKNVLAIGFQSTKAGLVMSIICKTI